MGIFTRINNWIYLEIVIILSPPLFFLEIKLPLLYIYIYNRNSLQLYGSIFRTYVESGGARDLGMLGKLLVVRFRALKNRMYMNVLFVIDKN